jgi:predicted lipoprotein with Yx(FWY)xxD motif
MLRNRWWAAPVLAAAVIGLAACGSTASSTPPATGAGAGSGSSGTATGPGIKTASTSVGTILVNTSGKTMYWFAIDTPTKSNCNGGCASFWPPVPGPVTPASGVTLSGTFGTIKRADGTTQATYNGHPLYTYKGDTSAGQATGNGLNISGGFWWAMTPTGAKPAAAPASTPSNSGGGGGYGY